MRAVVPPAALGMVADHRRAVLAVLLAAILLSTGGVFIKASDGDALTISMWRSAFALPVILLFVRFRVPHPLRAHRTTLAGAACYALLLLLFVVALRLTTAANAIFLQFTAPLYVAALGPWLLRERASRLDLLTLAVAMAGMALFFVGRFEGSSLVGNLVALGSGIAFAGLILTLRAPSMTPASRLDVVILGSVVLVAVLGLVNLFRDSGAAFTPAPDELLRMLYLGVVQVGLAYVIYSAGVARVPALEASLVNMVEPVLNPVWVVLVLGERPGWWAAAGGAIIVVAITVRAILVERQARRTAPRAIPAAATT